MPPAPEARVTSATFFGCPDRTRRKSLALRIWRNKLHENSTFSGRSSPRRGGTYQNSRRMRHSSVTKPRGSLTPLLDHTSLSLRIRAPKTVRGSYPAQVHCQRGIERGRHHWCGNRKLHSTCNGPEKNVENSTRKTLGGTYTDACHCGAQL